MNKRFEFALKETNVQYWKIFEQLASSFLTSEFPNLRTMASPGGDGGRDAELFVDDGEPTTVIQYSVTEAWDQKIKDTVKRLKKTMPGVTFLIYVTSQVIGAKADSLKSVMRKEQKVIIDVRDANWFLENSEGHVITVENYCQQIVDPILKTQGIDVAIRPSMSDAEAKAALLCDLKDYFHRLHQITVSSLEEACEAVSDDFRHAVTEFWIGVHTSRRSKQDDGFDELAIQRLARHDVENYVGVIGRRRGVPSETAIGYPYWWLTFDSEAFQILKKINRNLKDYPRHSPVMSPDFLLTYLRFGPKRGKHVRSHLPVMLEFANYADLPPELVSALQEVRDANSGAPEYVIQRKLRDRLDSLRSHPGSAVSMGLGALIPAAK